MNRTMLMLSAALFVGGLVVFGLYTDAYTQAATGGVMVEVLAAGQDIDLGEPVRAEWLTTKALPQGLVEDRHLFASAARDLIGLPLAQSVHAGEAILRTDLSPLSDSRRTLSGNIPAGQRAVTVITTSTSTFGGLLRPGDRVDVLLTAGDVMIPASWRAVFVLENVLVLAVGQNVQDHSSDEQREVRLIIATNVTLQLTLDQSAMIAQARLIPRAHLHLFLRNPNDIEVSPTGRPDLVAQDVLDPARRVRFLRRVAVARTAPPPPLVPLAPDGSLGTAAGATQATQ